jgi:signal peptidase II
LRLKNDIRWRWAAFIGLAVVVIVADQISKAWIRANLVYGDPPTQVIGDLVRLVFSHNSGGIFGLFGDSALILAASSLVVIGLIVVYEWREGSHSWLLTLALGLLLGGAIGNFLDRLFYGYVTDFIDVGIGNSRFYTFNVADSAISTALLLLVLIALLHERRTRQRPAPEASQS